MSAVAVPPAYALAAVIVLISVVEPTVAHSQPDPDASPLAVRSLSIQGVTDLDVDDITRVLVTRVSGSLPLVGRDRFFTRRQFQQDLYRIVAYLSDNGYPRARIASVDIDEDVERGDVHLTVYVEPGAPVIVERVQTYGFDVLGERDQESVAARVHIREGARRVQSDVRATQAATLAILQERGYAHSVVTVLETDGAAPSSVRLFVVADPGPLTTFGEITISGNGTVSDGRVRSLLTFREGDSFRLSRLQESQRRLYARDVFQFVNMEVTHGDGTAREVPVHVRLTQAKPYRVSVAPGYGSEERARVTGTFSNVNAFGGARTASVQTKWSSLDRGARANFEEPSLFRRGVGLGASVQYWYANEPAYSLHTSGGRLTLARDLSRSDPVRRKQALTTVSTTFVHEYEDYAISDFALEDLTFRDEIIALGLDPTRGTGGGTLVALGFDIQHTTTPNLIDARQGYLVNFHVEQAGRWLPGDFNYIEYSGEGRYYATIAQRAVLAGRLRMGTMSAPGTLPANVPFFKRYFLGGASSLRGWGRFQVGPLSGSGLPIGGHSFLESSLEARVPLFGALSSVVFLDAGNAWAGSFDYQFDDLRYALGTGIRYLTPIGPVRMDVGYQLNPIATLLVDGRPEARRWRLHFSIGQAF